MSFSSEVKEELARLTSGARHCKIAELAGILNFCGEVREEKGIYLVKVHTENVSVAKRFFTLLKDTFHIHGTSGKTQRISKKKSKLFGFC